MLLLPLLEKTINAALSLDSESQQRLSKIAGKVITIELLPFHFIFQLQIQATHVAVLSGEALPANTKITGTPLQFLAVTLDKQNRHAFFADDINMQGDAEFGRQVIELLDDLEIDWEEHSSRLIGDVAAHHLGRLTKKFLGWVSAATDSCAEDINEYVHEEAALFPPRQALQDFYDEVDQLRMAADRIQARFEQLRAGDTK